MKKFLIISLLASALILTGCKGTGKKSKSESSESETSSQTSSQTSSSGGSQSSQGSSGHSGSSSGSEAPVGTPVTIYLSLGEIGLYNGQKGQDYGAPIYLENAIKFDTKVGEALPDASVITSTSGATFANWMAYDGEGAPTRYDTAPGINNKILYAAWEGGGDVPPQPGETKTFSVDVGVWDTDGAKFAAWVWKDGSEGSWVEFTDSLTINKTNTKMILVRLDPSKPVGWDAKWNQTDDITIDYSKSGIRITGWSGSDYEWIA